VTRWTTGQIDSFEKAIQTEEIHPRDAKMQLAQEITAAFYDEAQAEKARAYFVDLFQKGDTPDEMPEFAISEGQTLLDVLTESGTVRSGSQVRRLVQQNGVKVDGEKVEDPFLAVTPGMTIQVGKRRFLKLVGES
jgi:tyrosyl-tRNA synthetase